jgi:hypothetical protein
MKIKDIIFPFVIIPVAVLFVIISFLVWLKNGESKRLVRAKLKTGAIVLSLSWFIALSGCQTGTTTCYDSVMDHTYVSFGYDSFPRYYHFQDTITGWIGNSRFPFYSYSINDSNNISRQKGMVTPKDGTFNTNHESFLIQIDSLQTPGKYTLWIYGEQTYQAIQNQPIEGAYCFTLR